VVQFAAVVAFVVLWIGLFAFAALIARSIFELERKDPDDVFRQGL
jgi:hypothetical protein